MAVCCCSLTTDSGSGAGGSASGLGPEGRRFESCLPDYITLSSNGRTSGFGPLNWSSNLWGVTKLEGG